MLVAGAGRRHRHALDFEARLDDVAEWKRGPQAFAVTLLGLVDLAADQRAVGEEVKAEVLRAGIACGQLEQLAGERLGSLDVAHCDEHLADADERAGLTRSVGEFAAEQAALLERV